MQIFSKALLCSVGVVANAQGATQTTTTYDLSADWSDAHNPSGPWSYNGGNKAIAVHQSAWISACYVGSQPAWAAKPIGKGHIPAWYKMRVPVRSSCYGAPAPTDLKIGDVAMHETDGFNGLGTDLANVTWTSPCAGNADVVGAVWLTRDIGRSMDWRVTFGPKLMASGKLWSGDPWNRANPVRFAFKTPVSPGGVLKLEFKRTSTFGDIAGVRLTVKVDQICGHYGTYGKGCGPLLGFTGLPLIGKTFSVDLSRAKPKAPGFLLFGRTSLSLDLSYLGMPGCRLLSSLEGVWPLTTDSMGRKAVLLPIPNMTSLIGTLWHNQFFVFDPAANRLGLLSTRGGRARVGKP